MKYNDMNALGIIKNNKDVNINVRVTRDFRNILNDFCKKRGISVSNFVSFAIFSAMQNQNELDDDVSN